MPRNAAPRAQCIIKYVRPRGEREAVLRVDWRRQVCSYELRSACAPLVAGSTATIVPAYQRLSTHHPAFYHSQKEKHVPTAAVREASAVCEGLAARLLGPGVEADQVRMGMCIGRVHRGCASGMCIEPVQRWPRGVSAPTPPPPSLSRSP